MAACHLSSGSKPAKVWNAPSVGHRASAPVFYPTAALTGWCAHGPPMYDYALGCICSCGAGARGRAVQGGVLHRVLV